MIELFDFLKNNNIEVFFIGQHKGPCRKEYVVIKDNGTKSQLGTNRVGATTVDLIFFVPINKFTRCEAFKREVKELLKSFKKVRYSGNETPIINDDEKESLTFSVLYQINKKLL